MTFAREEEPSSRRSLRLWPGIVIVGLQWLVRFGLPVVMPDAAPIAVIGGVVGGLGVVLWWVFFSKAAWFERLGAVGLMIAAMFATSRITHESIATGAMGMLFVLLAIPFLSLAFVTWAAASRHLSKRSRHASMAVTIFIACGVWALVRTGGLTGNFDNDLQWRWAKTPEERLLTQPVAAPASAAPETVPVKIPEKQQAAKPNDQPALLPTGPPRSEALADWPSFRGRERDSILRGVRIKTDWSASPPVELWRRPVGPGWSSFAVRGDLIYTQEQRGPDEVVACYRRTTGTPVWVHRDTARFWESNAGAGPRSTPTLGNGRIYTFGATGILNALNAGTGKVVWSRNAASDTETKPPEWGFASSPLLLDDVVIVAVSGQLVAYDRDTGTPRWFGPRGGVSYSSPHLLKTNGVTQILLLSREGATSMTPADGKVLWEHLWKGNPIVQPALTPDGDVLISVNESSGTRRISVENGLNGWNVEERWTSNGLKPYFNDFVVHDGHAFGFDGSILACIDLQDGKRKWKGGRYGHGQLVLLKDQALLLVLSEEGELALIKATTDQFTEVARLPAIQGKTWNHPVLAGDVLLARNGEEMVAFRLTLEER